MVFPAALWDSTAGLAIPSAGIGGENENVQMPTVNNSARPVEDSVAAAEAARLELERCGRELDECCR